MSKKDLILRALRVSFDEESWYAPLGDAVTGLTAKQAMWKPAEEGAKSIWENVNHLLYYKERLVAKMENREWEYSLSGDENFFYTTPSSNDTEWDTLVERLKQAQKQLVPFVEKLSEQQLEESNLETQLLDITLHEAYHTGQIMLIRKMEAAWPQTR